MRGGDFNGVCNASIVFCSMAAGTAHLDCVSETEATRGWPFTMVVGVPPLMEWSVIASRLLERWADTATAISIRLEAGADGARIRLADRTGAVRLDLVSFRLEPVV